ncbi:MAG: hypothetical protein Q7W13_05105 [Bacteroidia bacterium]|nr:hypothetical protein [Bacteroidia bacterium]
MRKFSSILIILIVFQGCTLDNDEIKGRWKCCGDNPVLRDFPEFTDSNLRNDTVYGRTIDKRDTAIAVIFKTEKRWFADNVIYIRLLGSRAIGRYCSKK